MKRYAIERIEQPERLDALQPEWNALLERAPRATPFQSPDWVRAWWRHLHPGSLEALALWDGERLAGFAPLYVEQQAAGRERLALIGTGISDYLGFLLDRDDEREAATALIDEVRRARAGRWCELDQLAPGDPVLAAVNGDAVVAPQEPCWVLRLLASEAAYESTLPPRVRSRLRGRYRRRLNAVGVGPLELAGADDVPEFLDALFALHEARRQTRGLPGALGDPSLQAFHHEVAAAFFARGWLRLYGLRASGLTVAVLYVLHFRERAYAYLSGFDPELAPYSPGVVTIDGAIRDAIGRGLSEFDFLRGREPYKRTWGAEERWNMRVIL